MPVPPAIVEAWSEAWPRSGCVWVGRTVASKASSSARRRRGEADRVDADVVAAAVGGAAGDVDREPDEAAVRGHDRERRRFGDDGGVGADAGVEDGARAGARPLLVGDGADDDLAGELVLRRRRARRRRTSRRRRPSCRRSRGRRAAVALGGVEGWVDHAVDADDVEVAVEHEGAAAAGAADAGDDVRAAGECVRRA